jgi:DNA-binding transcriptional MerR regulator
MSCCHDEKSYWRCVVMTLIYKAKEVMEKLEIKDSVFKKYISILEKEGYIIQKNQQGHRLFTDEDIKTLEKFIELSKYDGMTLESVAKMIGSTKQKNEGHDVIEEKEQSHDVMTLITTAVTTALEEQAKLHSAQLQQMQEQLNRIESNQNDRDLKLVQSLRESQETKKLLLEVKEQIAASQEEKKKGFFSRFFK